MTTIVLATLVIPTAVSTLVAQAPSGLPPEALASPCVLLSAAEVNQATGREDYRDGEVLADADEGGAMCMYGIPWEAPAASADVPPPVVVSTFSADEGGDHFVRDLGSEPRQGCTLEPVSGVGEVAFMETCPEDVMVRAKVGAYGLLVMAGLQAPATEASARAAAVALAKAAAAKLR